MMNEEALEEKKETMMEVREDLMLSPAGDSLPSLRTAHFLNPITNSISEPNFVFKPNHCPFKFRLKGWVHTHDKWVKWVDTLKPKYESIWKKVGIFEAIMSSTMCSISQNQNLLTGVMEKWCCETNTFVFQWGEATITLEDVVVLGGYPILGDHPVFTKIETLEMREVEKKLIHARQQPWRIGRHKAKTTYWMDIFIDKGSEIEHEAFLAMWLSFYVFPNNSFINKSLFPIAIHLARGNQIALAPPVLASIYRDLSLLVGLTKPPVVDGKFPLDVILGSPFFLVQIWVWERFKNLQPVPNVINHGDPLLFRWHKVKALPIDNVGLALNSAVDDFVWRPYGRYADNCSLFYPKDEIWVTFETDLDKKLLSFLTCMRVSELLGIDTIEQYLPHRVAMQFGMDQDVPGRVPRFNDTKLIAWENYCRRICDENLYVPSRLFEGDVTIGYAKWWKQSIFGHPSSFENVVRRKRSGSSSIHTSKAENIDTVIIGKRCDDSSSKSRKLDDIYADGYTPKLLKTVPSEYSVQDGSEADQNIEADAPTSSPPMYNTPQAPSISVEDCMPDGKEYNCGGIIHDLSNKHCSSASSAACEKILPPEKPVAKDNNEVSVRGLEEGFKESKEPRLFSGRVCLCGSEGESHEHVCEMNVMKLEERISRLERVIKELKMKRFGHS